MDFELQPIQREIEIKGFHSIYYFEFDKNFSHLPEKHDFWEMVYVDKGNITAITDGFAQTVSHGQVIFHKPDEIHAHISNKIDPNNMLVISFTTHSPEMMFFDKKIFTLDKTAQTLLTLFLSEAKNALHPIPYEYENKKPLDFSQAAFGSVQLLECYLTEFLIILKRSNKEMIDKFIYSNNSRIIAQNSLLDLIIDYMKKNIHSSISVKDICNHFLMCKTQVFDLFNKNLGTSPIDYFNTLKTEYAKDLLKNKSFSVSHIANTLGYINIHSFSRAFKNITGSSPSEYRKGL